VRVLTILLIRGFKYFPTQQLVVCARGWRPLYHSPG
jgi:hypothetical protein